MPPDAVLLRRLQVSRNREGRALSEQYAVLDISGAKTPEQVRENVGASDRILAEPHDERAVRVHDLLKQIKIAVPSLHHVQTARLQTLLEFPVLRVIAGGDIHMHRRILQRLELDMRLRAALAVAQPHCPGHPRQRRKDGAINHGQYLAKLFQPRIVGLLRSLASQPLKDFFEKGRIEYLCIP